MEKFKEILITIFTHKRMKSFYWRATDLGVVAFADVSTEVLTNFDIPNWITMGIGLALGEVTKYLNTKK